MRKAFFIHEEAIPDGKCFSDLTDEELIEMYNDDATFIWVYDSLDAFVEDFDRWDTPVHYTSFARMVDFPD